MATDYLPDLPTLLDLCAQASAYRAEELAALQTDTAAEDRLMVEAAAASHFGPEAAATFGAWQPVDVVPDDTLQMFARLTDAVYLRYTAELDGDLGFDLVVTCDACLSCREVRVHGLTDLAAALTGAGVR